MKIKYTMPNKKHPTCIVTDGMNIKQIEAVIAFLESQDINFEYLNHKG